jgi:hypothetical protein
LCCHTTGPLIGEEDSCHCHTSRQLLEEEYRCHCHTSRQVLEEEYRVQMSLPHKQTAAWAGVLLSLPHNKTADGGGVQLSLPQKQTDFTPSIKYQGARRLASLCTLWRHDGCCVHLVYRITAAGIPSARSWAAPVRAIGLVWKRSGGKAHPSHTKSHLPAMVTLLQPTRRPAVLGKPSSLRTHFVYLQLYIQYIGVTTK